MMIYQYSKEKGVTIIELAVVIAVIGILTIVAIITFDRISDQARFDATMRKLENIKKAIAGDPAIQKAGARTSFGYFGDMGNAPASVTFTGADLAPLVNQGGQPSYNFSTGMGWNGPYLEATFGTDYQLDGYGRAFRYNTGAGVTIASNGKDGIPNNADDISVTISPAEVVGSISVYVYNDAGPVNTANVQIISPVNGVASTSALTMGNNGYYSFPSIPYGKRVITVNGQSCNGKVGPVTVTPRENIVKCRI